MSTPQCICAQTECTTHSTRSTTHSVVAEEPTSRIAGLTASQDLRRIARSTSRVSVSVLCVGGCDTRWTWHWHSRSRPSHARASVRVSRDVRSTLTRATPHGAAHGASAASQVHVRRRCPRQSIRSPPRNRSPPRSSQQEPTPAREQVHRRSRPAGGDCTCASCL